MPNYSHRSVDWAGVGIATAKEYARIKPRLESFASKNSDWKSFLWVATSPPEIMMSFFLDPCALQPRRRRRILTDPDRVAILSEEEMAIPATFVAEVMGEMNYKRMSHDPSILEYRLRVNFDLYQHTVEVHSH